MPSGWRNSDYQAQKVQLRINDTEYTFQYRRQGDAFEVQVDEWTETVRLVRGGGSSALLDIGESLRTIPFVWEGNTIYQLLGGRALAVEVLPRFPERQSEVEKGGLITRCLARS